MSFVFDTLVAQGLNCSWDCEGSYGYCGSASCSKLDIEDGGADVCVCLEEHGSFTMHIDSTVAFLALAPLFYAGVQELSAEGEVGSATKAALCAAHADGSLYRSAGMDVPTGSWHAPIDYGRRALSSGSDDGGDLEITCMGAPCWHHAPLDGDCTLLCLCPRGYVPPGNTDDYTFSYGNGSSCENHNGDSTTADSAETLGLVVGHLAANVRYAEIDLRCNKCVTESAGAVV